MRCSWLQKTLGCDNYRKLPKSTENLSKTKLLKGAQDNNNNKNQKPTLAQTQTLTLTLNPNVPTGNFRSQERKFPATFIPWSKCSQTRNVIARSLFLIFRRSLEFETLPSDWKLAEIMAVHKKGSKSDSGNYRPISLTSVCCKIFESLVPDHIMKHLLDNNLLSNKQYGFIKGRSTMLQLLHMMDDWTLCLEKGGQIDAIYSDFEKAMIKSAIKD